MIEEDSAGFVEAFTAAVRPHGPRSRPLKWMLLVGFAIVFAAALGSLLNGAFGSGSSSSSSSSSGSSGTGSTLLGGATAPATIPLSGVQTLSTGSATTPAASTSFSAVAGPECTGSGAEFTESGFSLESSDPATAWSVSGTGGFKGDGCTGGFLSMPVSGNANAIDTNRYTVWSFTLGAALLTKASCKLEVYVPSNTSPALVGGDPAYYYYYDSVYTSSNSPKPLGDFAVYQTANRGRWLTARTFTVTTGVVAVRMVDAGVDQGSGASGIVRDAAAQVRLTCSVS
jgi:hypothetical protein